MSPPLNKSTDINCKENATTRPIAREVPIRVACGETMPGVCADEAAPTDRSRGSPLLWVSRHRIPRQASKVSARLYLIVHRTVRKTGRSIPCIEYLHHINAETSDPRAILCK